MIKKKAGPLFSVLLVVLMILLQNGNYQIKAATTSQTASPIKPRSNIDPSLTALHQEWLAHIINSPNEQFSPSNTSMPIVEQQYVIVDAVATLNAEQLARQLESMGARNVSVFGRMVSGAFPIGKLDSLQREVNLKMVRPAYAITHVGDVTSQGDIAMHAALARITYGVDGSGVTIGTLSDSYDCLGGAAADVVSGDLPAGIIVLDDTSCPASDEGRAMMQLIADTAPGSAQAFHTAFNGQADFANGIIELQGAGANVIVDDVFYFAEPFFQDGVIAQAVEQVYAQGAAYFSSAGNSARDSYQDAFRDSGETGPLWDGILHDFDPGNATDTHQRISIPTGSTLILSFQWDQPFSSVSGAPGSANDIDIAILNTSGSVMAQGVSNNVGNDAVEVISFTNNTGSTAFDLIISKYSGSNPGLMKYIAYGQMTPTEYATNSSTIVGHANAAHAQAVGAAFYGETPAFGISPALREQFSSGGATPILFDTAGSSVNILHDKPEIVAPDGTNTTFFGSDTSRDSDSWPNFFGTSAAAPHAAAAAALMLDQNGALWPQIIYDIMEYTASDMNSSGFDTDTGYGLIQANEATAQGALVTGAFSDNPASALQQNAPNNSSTNNAPSFRWDAMPEATEYQLVVYYVDGDQVVHNQHYTRLEAACTAGGECAVTPPLSLSAGEYRWLVRPFNIYGYGPWSSWP